MTKAALQGGRAEKLPLRLEAPGAVDQSMRD